MKHFEAAIIGLNVQLGPEERLHAHETSFNYSLSKLIVTCTQTMRHYHSSVYCIARGKRIFHRYKVM